MQNQDFSAPAPPATQSGTATVQVPANGVRTYQYHLHYLMPLGAFAMILGIVITRAVLDYRVRRLRSQERLAAIEKGMPLPEELILNRDRPRSTRDRAEKSRSQGIRLIAIGVGLMLFFGTLRGHGMHHGVTIFGVGFIPLTLGVGMLIDSRLQYSAAEAETNQGGPAQPMPQ